MKIQSIRMVFLLVPVCLAISSVSYADPPIPIDPTLTEQALLRYQFVPGSTDAYRTEMTQAMSMTGPGMAAAGDMVMRMAFTTNQSVQSVSEEGVAQVHQTISDVTASMTVGGQTMPIQEMIAPQLSALAVTMQMNPRGEVLDTQFGEMQDPAMQQMMSMMEGPMSQMSIEFPEDPIAVGDTWTQQVPFDMGDVALGLEANATGTYTFLGYALVGSAPCAVLQTDVTLTISGTFNEQGMTATATGGGQGSGYTYFDNVAGKLQQANMDMTMNMSIVAEGMTIEQAMNMSMTFNKI